MRLALVLLAALLVLPASAAGARTEVPPGAVAVVAGEPITVAEFDALMERARRSYAEQKRTFPRPGTQAYETLKKAAVQFLVTRTMFRQKATALGIVVTAEELEARRVAIVRQYFGGSEARFRAELAKQGYTEADFLLEIADQLRQERLFEALTGDVTVTDTELEVYYHSHLAEFRKPASRVVRHILVRTRALAVSLRARIVRGESFAALARRYSTDPGSRQNGGRLTVGRGQTVAAFDRAAFSLKTHALSQPVHTQYGWHLIEPLSAIRAGSTTTFAGARDRIEELLLQEKKNDRMMQWLEDTRDEYETKIEYAPGFEP